MDGSLIVGNAMRCVRKINGLAFYTSVTERKTILAAGCLEYLAVFLWVGYLYEIRNFLIKRFTIMVRTDIGVRDVK